MSITFQKKVIHKLIENSESKNVSKKHYKQKNTQKTEHNHKTTQKKHGQQTNSHSRKNTTTEHKVLLEWLYVLGLCVCVCALFCGVFGSLFPTTLSITFSQSPYFNHFHFCQTTLSITFLNDVSLITFLNHFSESLFHSLLTKVNKLQILNHTQNKRNHVHLPKTHTNTHPHTHTKKQKQSTKNKNSFIPREEHNKHQKQTHKKKEHAVFCVVVCGWFVFVCLFVFCCVRSFVVCLFVIIA